MTVQRRPLPLGAADFQKARNEFPLGGVLRIYPLALSRTELAAVNARKTVASAKPAHLTSLFWDRLVVNYRKA